MTGWIEKQRNILDFTLSSLLRRKGRNASLFLVYTLIVFLLGSAMFYIQAMKREASLILKDTPEIVVQGMLQGRYTPVAASHVEKIRTVRGVVSVSTRLWGYYWDPVTGANYTMMVPRDRKVADGSIVIGNGIARSRQIEPGDILSFLGADGETKSFTVAGMLSPESELVSADLMLLPESGFREMYGLPATQATDLVVSVRNPREVRTVARKIAEMLPRTRPILREEMSRTYDSVFDWRGGIVLVLLAVSLVSFAILAWDKASGLSAEERREIGILKAIGWETADVIAVKTYEGAFVSFFSFSIGILLAYAHVFFASAFLFAPALKGWSVLYPSFRITPFVDLYQLAVLFFLTVVPYTVATVVPSWRASIVDPDSVMRT